MSNNKAAVTTFGNFAHRIIKCDDHQTIESFNEAVDKIKRFPWEYTNMRDGLDKGQISLEQDGCGLNNNARRIIILMTDGYANRGLGKLAGLFNASSAIKAKGTIIQGLAVGRDGYRLLKRMIPLENIYRVNKLENQSPKFLSNINFSKGIRRYIFLSNF